MKHAFSVGLYIKLFQITPYANDFQTFNNPGSGQPVGLCLEKLVLPSIFDTGLLHHHRRVFQVTAAPLRDPWRSQISTA